MSMTEGWAFMMTMVVVIMMIIIVTPFLTTGRFARLLVDRRGTRIFFACEPTVASWSRIAREESTVIRIVNVNVFLREEIVTFGIGETRSDGFSRWRIENRFERANL